MIHTFVLDIGYEEKKGLKDNSKGFGLIKQKVVPFFPSKMDKDQGMCVCVWGGRLVWKCGKLDIQGKKINSFILIMLILRCFLGIQIKKSIGSWICNSGSDRRVLGQKYTFENQQNIDDLSSVGLNKITWEENIDEEEGQDQRPRVPSTFRGLT